MKLTVSHMFESSILNMANVMMGLFTVYIFGEFRRLLFKTPVGRSGGVTEGREGRRWHKIHSRMRHAEPLQ